MMKTREKNRTSMGMLVASVLAVTMVAFPAISGATLVTPAAPLGADAFRVHPTVTGPPKFNIYTGGALSSNGWTLATTALVTSFNNGSKMIGQFTTEVWKNDTDAHLLFAYEISNDTNSTPISTGNIAGYGSGITVTDCGLFHIGGGSTLDSGDMIKLSRTGGSTPSLDFAFYDATFGGANLAAGSTSSWFYFETNATSYTTSIATLQDSGESVDGVAVYVPVPEPATMSLLAVGVAGLLLKRRRKA